MFGFAIAHQSRDGTISYPDSDIGKPVTFTNMKKGAKIYKTVSDVCNHICSQFVQSGEPIGLLPAEFRIISFVNEIQYLEWLKHNQSNWFYLGEK